MPFKSFTITSNGGFYDYPLPPENPFRARITLRGVDAETEIGKAASEGPLVACAQVHGARVIAAREAPAWPERESADGVFVRPGDPAAAMRFADCAPVLILRAGPRPWLLLLHSGFKGTVANIVSAGLAFARSRAGGFDPGVLLAWVGPCVSGDCYARRRDDPSTAAALSVFAPEAARETGDFVLFDLKLQIARQLAAEGVPEERISLETQCTYRCADLFYSHRRSVPGNDPRMLLMVRSRVP